VHAVHVGIVCLVLLLDIQKLMKHPAACTSWRFYMQSAYSSPAFPPRKGMVRMSVGKVAGYSILIDNILQL